MNLQLQHHWLWIIPLKLLMLGVFGQFSGLLSYFSVPDLRRLFFACLTSSLALLAIRYRFVSFYTDPRGVILIDFMLSMSSLSLMRLGFRVIRERYLMPEAKPPGAAAASGFSAQAMSAPASPAS